MGGTSKRITLNFHINKEAGFHLLESPLSEDQQVREPKNAYEISATVADSAQLEWWLRGFGNTIRRVTKESCPA